MKTKSPFTNKRFALIAALQSGAAYDFAVLKSRRLFKHEASTKKPYKRGTLGPSLVAQAIKKQYGGIISRADRKALAKHTGQPRTLFSSRG